MSETTFRKAGLTVLVGSAAGFGIGLLLTPVISRVFDPHTYGIFATVTAVVSVFVGISTFRLEIESQRTSDDDNARALLTLGLLGALIWALVLTVAGVIAVIMVDASQWWLAVGGLVLFGSLQLLGTAALTRRSRYKQLAMANFAQGSGAGVAQVILGWWSATVWSLLAGFAIARLIWFKSIGWPVQSRAVLGDTLRRSYRFALVAGASAGVNSLAGQLPILLASWFYGGFETGQLAMAVRVLVSPLSIVGQAAAAATVGEVGRRLRENHGNAPQLVRKGMRDLAGVALLPCGLAAAGGAWIVPIALGSEWRQAGVLIALVSVGTFAQFVAAPFSQILNLAGHNRALLSWDVARFASILCSLAIPAAVGMSFETAITVYSVTLVVIYTALGVLARRAAANPVKPERIAVQ